MAQPTSAQSTPETTPLPESKQSPETTQSQDSTHPQPEPVLCPHCLRTATNGIKCQGICVADSGY